MNESGKPYKIFADQSKVEYGALKQFFEAMSQDFVVKGALMPDVHQGYTLPIGGVVACENFVVPSYVGMDIGCGVLGMKLSVPAHEIKNSVDAIQEGIKRVIPLGFKHRSENLPSVDAWLEDQWYSTVVGDLIRNGAMTQMGTLGGGNHFIEVGIDRNKEVWLIIHSGSRNIGNRVATHYIKEAHPESKCKDGHYGFFTDSENGRAYLLDMNFCANFALQNRLCMAESIRQEMSDILSYEIRVDETINSNHNLIEIVDEYFIHRKGATPAKLGELGVIPANMRDGAYIVVGKGNNDSMQSASHGAGRPMSRTKAKATLSMDKFRNDMDGIAADVVRSNLDESPDAYKDIEEVMEHQESCVAILNHVSPIINVKG